MTTCTHPKSRRAKMCLDCYMAWQRSPEAVAQMRAYAIERNIKGPEQHPWCPPEWLPFRRDLVASGFPPEEARRIIEDHLAVVARREARAKAA